jgi:UrcA family protein
MKYFTGPFVTLAMIISCSAIAEHADAGKRFAYDQRRIVVEYHDLDLSNPAEARVFLDRIKTGVAKACERMPLGEGTSAGKDRQRCLQETETTSMASIKASLSIDAGALATHISDTRKNVIAAGE